MNELRLPSHVSGYFLIRKFFSADSKISMSTSIRIQLEFARPHISGFTLSSSANLASVLRLMRTFYRQSSSSITVSPTKLPHQAVFRSFNLFTASNSFVLHGKKLQTVEPPFDIIEV